VIPIAQPSPPLLDPIPLPLDPVQPSIDPGPAGNSVTPVAPVRIAARFVTPEADIKPPYPQSKLRAEEEAVLRLRLSIDARGRVTGVEAVGAADPVFLAAARRHLIAHWRYRPATEDGRPVATSTVITLRFELSD
jgi:protein TonB